MGLHLTMLKDYYQLCSQVILELFRGLSTAGDYIGVNQQLETEARKHQGTLWGFPRAELVPSDMCSLFFKFKHSLQSPKMI